MHASFGERPTSRGPPLCGRCEDAARNHSIQLLRASCAPPPARRRVHFPRAHMRAPGGETTLTLPHRARVRGRSSGACVAAAVHVSTACRAAFCAPTQPPPGPRAGRQFAARQGGRGLRARRFGVSVPDGRVCSPREALARSRTPVGHLTLPYKGRRRIPSSARG
eukprot:scaffold624_cov402-Prasinococcus_capsulatus_cf.AAC.23